MRHWTPREDFFFFHCHLVLRSPVHFWRPLTSFQQAEKETLASSKLEEDFRVNGRGGSVEIVPTFAHGNRNNKPSPLNGLRGNFHPRRWERKMGEQVQSKFDFGNFLGLDIFSAW